MKFLVVFFVMLSSVVFPSPLDEARILFFQFDENKQASKQMLSLLQGVNNPSPIVEAYMGVAIAAGADHEMSPIAKYRRFSEGKNLIEKAIKKLPDDAEIRMLRLSIQTAAPVFLGYRSNLEEDKKMMIEALRSKKGSFMETQFRAKVLIYLLEKVSLTSTERNIVNDLINKQEK